MKKIILGFALVVSGLMSAQEIGVRFGDITGNSVAVDGVFDFKGSRLHADVSFGGDGVGIDALYDFIYKPLGAEAFYWYAGVGPSAYFGDDFLLGVSGEAGLEYRFTALNLVLGVDYRPTFWILEDTDFNWGSFGINVRYCF